MTRQAIAEASSNFLMAMPSAVVGGTTSTHKSSVARCEPGMPSSGI
jgi:hypothetical protein